ncbi:MAG: glycosyltransferase family 2 protein [Flavobacteriia bacterium]|nr:glycosyltransferase family 2 protein [Flavobacteriia bacterium]
MNIDVIIPAHNEEKSIEKVINEIPKQLVRNIIVVCNCCTDNTEEKAKNNGAITLIEKNKGYGWSCLKGMEFISSDPPDIVVFLDGDYSDYPKQMVDIVNPILKKEVKMVIGSRKLGKAEKGSLTPQQVFGNWLACWLMKIFYRANFTDLGPFRAIDHKSLILLNMMDKTYGWTIEMQIKAHQKKIPYTEVPVDYKKRIGVSKVSGTLKGTIFAGIKIIFAVLKYRF